MPQLYRGKPRSASRFVLSSGRTAVLVRRKRKHYSKLQNGYPLAEEYLRHLSSEGVEAVAIDDGERLHVFGLRQYRTGERIGHAPYPMKRVASLDDATRTLTGDERAAEIRAAEWEWLTEDDLQPTRERTARTEDSSGSVPGEPRDDSVSAD